MTNEERNKLFGFDAECPNDEPLIVMHPCQVCDHPTTNAICGSCEESGWWIDPAGGLHNDKEFSDPARMYE